MIIGIDAKRAFYNFRGLGNYTRNLIEGLVQFYPQLTLKLFTPPPADLRGKSWIKTLSYKKNHLNKNISIELCSPSSFVLKIFHSLWRSFFINEDFANKKLDIYHGMSAELPFFLPPSQSRKYKILVTIHDLIFIRYPHQFPLIDRIIYKMKVVSSCRQSDMILAICEQTKKDLIDILSVPEEKIRIIHQPCHPRFYHSLPETERSSILAPHGISGPYVLFVGAIEERKNVLRAVLAFHKMAKEIPHCFIIVGKGKGPYLAQIQDFINKENLSSRIKILSDITNEELPAFYQGADLFFFPSLFEGFGIPIIEALFSGTPVLTSHGSSFPESAGPDSFFINPEDVEEMSFALKRLLDDKLLRAKMSKQGLQYVQRFHWKETSNKLMDLYKEVLA